MRGLTLADPALVGAAAGFSPLSLSPALWLDASDAATITSSAGKVSQWSDKSGNGNHYTQSTSANQPTTGTVTKNGNNVIVYNDAHFVQRAVGSLSANLTPEVWIACVVLTYNIAPNEIFFTTGTASNAGLNFGWGGSNKLRWSLNAIADVGTYSTAGSSNVAYLIRAYRKSGGAFSISVNNSTTSGTDSRTHTTSSGFSQVGAYSNALVYLNGWIAEMIVLTSAPSAADQAQVETYLNAKWAVY